jgi:hypothetical protein
MAMLWWLIVGHALCDYPLQGDSMAKGKNRHTPPFNVPPGQKPGTVWPYWLGSHALIHGGMVALVTGSILLGVCETVAHAIIDILKCENVTNLHIDQLLHVVCKLLWVAAAFNGFAP